MIFCILQKENFPDGKIILQWVENFKATGSAMKKSHIRSRSFHTLDKNKLSRRSFLQSPRLSVWKLALDEEISLETTKWNFAQKNVCGNLVRLQEIMREHKVAALCAATKFIFIKWLSKKKFSVRMKALLSFNNKDCYTPKERMCGSLKPMWHFVSDIFFTRMMWLIQ